MIASSDLLPPPQAFLIFFLSAKSDWETGREQIKPARAGAGSEWAVRAQEAIGRSVSSHPNDSLRPSSLVNHYTQEPMYNGLLVYVLFSHGRLGTRQSDLCIRRSRLVFPVKSRMQRQKPGTKGMVTSYFASEVITDLWPGLHRLPYEDINTISVNYGSQNNIGMMEDDQGLRTDPCFS